MTECSATNTITQGYIVYRHGAAAIARGQIDGTILARDDEAATVMQAALDALAQVGGGELVIANGLFEIGRPLRLPDRVAVRGAGRATALKLGRANEEGVIWHATDVDGVIVADMVLQGIPSHEGSSGVILDQVGDGKVQGVYARDFSGVGICLRNRSFACALLNNTTSGNGRAGTLLAQIAFGGRGGDGVPNLVSGGISYGEKGHGFELEGSVCQNLVGCLCFQPMGHGFYFHSHSCSNLLTGSRCFEGHRNAVMLDRAHESNIAGNIFCWNKGHGIEIKSVTWAVVCGNEVIDSGGVVDYAKPDALHGRAYGIYLHTDTKCAQVTGNTVFCWGDGHAPMINGIYEADDCRDNHIAANTANFYTDTAVRAMGRGTVVGPVLGIPKFYTEPWKGPFQTEKEQPTQLLKEFDGQRVAQVLDRTRH